MSFLALTPLQAAILLGGTGVVVVVLYLLKPPPRRVVIPSSLVWRRLLKARKKSTWLDRLRWWVSLLVALLVGLGVALALTGPELGAGEGERRNVAVVVDSSPTMATVSSDGYSRFEHAVERARQQIREAGEGSEFLVADTAGQVAAPRFVGRRQALETLGSLEVAATAERLRFPRLDVGDARLFFFSDGVRVRDVPSGVDVVSVFQPAANVAITAFEIRPVPADPTGYQAYLEVTNASPDARDVTIRVRGVGGAAMESTLALEPGGQLSETVDLAPFGRGPVRASVSAPGDALEIDDRAYAWLPARQRRRVTLVTRGNLYLETLLLLDPRVELAVVRPEDYDTAASADVLVFDRWAPLAAPAAPAILVRPSQVSWLHPFTGQVESPEIGLVPGAEPLLENVGFDDLTVERAFRVDLGSPPEALVEPGDAGGSTAADGSGPGGGSGSGGGSGAIGDSRTPGGGSPSGPARALPAAVTGARVVLGTPRVPLILTADAPVKLVELTFALDESNFPLQPGFPIFLSNALTWVMDEQLAVTRPPGRVEVPLSGARVADLEGDEVRTWQLMGRTVFEAVEPGLYTAATGDRRVHVAVNAVDRSVSEVNSSPLPPEASDPVFGAMAAVERSGGLDELWMLLLTGATLLVAAEWWTYHRRWTV